MSEKEITNEYRQHFLRQAWLRKDELKLIRIRHKVFANSRLDFSLLAKLK